MSKKETVTDSPKIAAYVTVRRETIIFMLLGALVIGFVAGTAWTIYSDLETKTPSTMRMPPEKTSEEKSMAGEPQPAEMPPNREALADIKARLDKNPNDAEAWIALGNLHFDGGDPSESVAAYEKALELKPDNPDVLTDLGVMYRKVGKPEKAVEAFAKASSVDPKHFRSLYNLGVVLLHDMRDIEGAVRAWEAYLQVAPQDQLSQRVRETLERFKGQKPPTG